MKVVFTGGGTGGHVIPNLAVIDELKVRDGQNLNSLEILYIGSKDGVEKKIIEDQNIRYLGVSCGKLRRYFSWQNFLDFLKIPVGVFSSLRILSKFKPEIVFSKGGYVSIPVVIAAWIKSIPVILHESDLSPGLANRICAKFATKICLSFEESKKFFKKQSLQKKLIITGNPVRKSILEGNPKKGYELTKFSKKSPILLVMGGSAGAQEINEFLEQVFEQITKKFQIIHITGKGKKSNLKAENYCQFEYLDQEFKDIYAICDYVLTRGGANSLAELAIMKKKVIVFPLSRNASRGDQVENAELFKEKMGWEIVDNNFNDKEILEKIKNLSEEKVDGLEKQIENGVDQIVNLILDFKKS